MKDTDKVTMTVGQLKKLVNEANSDKFPKKSFAGKTKYFYLGSGLANKDLRNAYGPTLFKDEDLGDGGVYFNIYDNRKENNNFLVTIDVTRDSGICSLDIEKFFDIVDDMKKAYQALKNF